MEGQVVRKIRGQIHPLPQGSPLGHGRKGKSKKKQGFYSDGQVYQEQEFGSMQEPSPETHSILRFDRKHHRPLRGVGLQQGEEPAGAE